MFIKFHNNFINKKLLFLLITVNTNIILSWDLISLGIQQDNYRLEHVSLYFLRAFICVSYTPSSLIPSSPTTVSLTSSSLLSSSSLARHSHNNNNNNNNNSNSNNTNNQSYSIKSLPTLIETTWPENLLILKPKFFPNLNAHALNDDRMNCKKLHQIKWTDIDDYGRLWIFDAGNHFNCNPKIVIYDLLRKNKEIFRTDCSGFNGNEVTMMKIDPDSSTFGYYAAYFTLSHGRYLSVFNLQDNKWYKIKISVGNEWDKKSIDVHEIAFTLDYRIYLADKIGNLYIANLDNKMRNSTELIAKPLGSLLGRPKGLITDPLGVLYYILPQHGAIVRWEPSRTLNAEGHDILHFQSIPIVQIIFGVQGSVWIASERFYAAHDHCYRILYHFSVSANEQ